ncbi:sodium/hydrogen exchanger 7 isoform X2 [Cimex lectularius]|uniref:Sodium/hydrogen exchanger n=1 Tax=Cimex lectularius TaxID=79782 RepID=A0A8I6R5G1_CIMLE|nr:sodium/hydrogen exchanger 7 isoform X2 [Cimex lectularius]
MAAEYNTVLRWTVLIVILSCADSESTDIELDVKAQTLHRIDSLNILLYTILLTATVLTIWFFKKSRLRFLHETGLAVIYGLIMGFFIRFAAVQTPVSHMGVVEQPGGKYNLSLPPDTLWLHFSSQGSTQQLNKTYAYSFRGGLDKVSGNEIDIKATFDPEIFFNIILPPIIFHAGYSLKRKYFFRNLGAILTYAVIGTSISAFVVGVLMYGVLPWITDLKYSFLDTLYFGAIISPTDPVTILAIFNDMKVDVNLYSLVFGESVLNDAVAIVLSSSIQNYERHSTEGGGVFESAAFLRAVGDFIGIFSFSLIIGSCMGCLTALLTKFTRIGDFPLLETALFVLMSYATFLIAEAADLTGIVSVLFCGIFQAHYTYNNLTRESRKRTKQLFELLNFLAENFIFSYLGVSMFTFPKHRFDAGFIIAGLFCAAFSRATNIYPLSFLLNLGRKPKIASNFQHMLFFAGLRGAMSFALAIRNTVSEARQAMLTTTSLIVIFTVIVQGGATMQLLSLFNIPVGVEEEMEALPYACGSHNLNYESTGNTNAEDGATSPRGSGEKAWLAKIWGNFDTNFMKPLLTHARPTLLETLPVSLNTIARYLTTTQQMSYSDAEPYRSESDSDLCIQEPDGTRGTQRNPVSIVPGRITPIPRLDA